MRYKITVTLRNAEGLTTDQVYQRDGDELSTLHCVTQHLELNRDTDNRGPYRADAAKITVELLP